jgi:muramoyltetrapeptide carboxypeptidase
VSQNRTKIGVVAPASRIDTEIAEDVKTLAADFYPKHDVELIFHPQCFLSSGHFAGDDDARLEAFLEIANDETFGALWFARGGYGSCRITEGMWPRLTAAAKQKIYLGYSDGGTLLAGLYKEGFPQVAHGPMPADIRRQGGEAAVRRALGYLVERSPAGLEASAAAGAKTAAFNMAILSQILGTPLQPDLSGHVLMLEEVTEYMYRIDRFLFQITSNPDIRQVAGLKLGRCSAIPPNEPDFGMTEEEVMQYWCEVSGIPYLGRADIGHDSDNKIVPFGSLAMV